MAFSKTQVASAAWKVFRAVVSALLLAAVIKIKAAATKFFFKILRQLLRLRDTPDDIIIEPVHPDESQ